MEVFEDDLETIIIEEKNIKVPLERLLSALSMEDVASELNRGRYNIESLKEFLVQAKIMKEEDYISSETIKNLFQSDYLPLVLNKAMEFANPTYGLEHEQFKFIFD